MKMKSREVSKDEMIDDILEEIYDLIVEDAKDEGNLNEDGKLDGISVAHSVLFIIDGDNPGIPSLDLNSIDENAEGLNGFLSQMLYEADDEKLLEYVQAGTITPMTKDFITSVRELIEKYDNDEITYTNELVAQILELIDNGIDGKGFELMAGGTEEDKVDAITNEYNYYPLTPVNIAGNLASRYREKYLPKVHERSADDMADMLVDQVATQIKIWTADSRNINSKGMIDGDFVAHLILSTIDGGSIGMPYFDLVIVPDEERINTELHSIKNNSVEEIQSFVEDGTLPKAKGDFLIEVKKLIEKYDAGELGDYDDLAVAIFEMMDNGFGEHKCELRAGIEAEDQIDYEEQFDDEIYVFPTDYPNIAGKLVEKYKEAAKNRDNDSKKKACITNMQNMLNASIGGTDRVEKKDVIGIRSFFNGIRQNFGGEGKDEK